MRGGIRKTAEYERTQEENSSRPGLGRVCREKNDNQWPLLSTRGSQEKAGNLLKHRSAMPTRVWPAPGVRLVGVERIAAGCYQALPTGAPILLTVC